MSVEANVKNNKIILALIISLCLTASAFAETLTVKSANGKTVASVAANGTVKNENGSKIGSIDEKGIVKNATGKIIGRIDKDGTVKNSSNAVCGKIEAATGIIQDHRDTLVGLLNKGTIINISGKEVGSYSGSSLEHTAAVIFFFDNSSMLPCSAVSDAKVFIYDKAGNIQGSLTTNTISDSNNAKKASIDNNGCVKDLTNNVIGTIAGDGSVKDANGQTVETFSPKDPNFMAKAIYTLVFTQVSAAQSASL